MRYSRLFGRTSKTVPSDADSRNARLLVQAGYVDQLMSGVYTYLPLGLRSLNRIKQVVREEMEAIGGQEILMPALTPREPWATTGRWNDPGPEVMFRLKGRGDKDLVLGWTHEEIVTPLVKRFIRSYKDLPVAVYQVQDKFRNEPRAKSGLLRGREFSMKDLYSFHRNQEDLDEFYERAKTAYLNVYRRCGLDAIVTEASGGAFSEYSHEYQVLTENGEDIIYYCPKCQYAQNREISGYRAGDACPKCGEAMGEGKAIEVGNIFRLGTRFTDPFGVTYSDETGKQQPVVMGCYGIGPSRVMGAIVEIHSDDRGIIWPKQVAPYPVQLVLVPSKDGEEAVRLRETAEKLASGLAAVGLEPLYDDREDVRAGEKFADADLIGLPVRLVVSPKSLGAGGVEWKLRSGSDTEIVPIDAVPDRVSDFYNLT
ncbi:hypothetical protein JW899_03125 [Candidatus Uhrbacteria bacterium]|nr:hypothetical protein [Candidatus Uhrbacteria bacterium]